MEKFAYMIKSDEEAVDEVSWVLGVQTVLVLLYFSPRKGLEFFYIVENVKMLTRK